MSVASYVCNEGYQPNVTSSVRVCRHNGTWSGAIIACGKQLHICIIDTHSSVHQPTSC